ncbi:ankyrin repeat-containing protein NPR4-like [Mangifera indica]|uniref:ankyrin repeat-containing protein NPR4-like n=1 Tax=Mangifera indica TaxID=29780 RepID=UPI001CFAF4EC|nr:ankyrin repeat-containing protein NPR4-like [Mangifera indica]
MMQGAEIQETVTINIDSSANAPVAPNEIPNGASIQSRWPSLLLPSRENRSNYLNTCVALHKAALKGDWGMAKHIFGQYPRSIFCACITKGNQTVLHIATAARQTSFVEELVKLMEPEELTLQDENGNSAFCFAAAVGAIQIAKIMLMKNPRLLTIRGSENMSPLYIAAVFAQRDTASFLYRETKDMLTEKDRIAIFFTFINTGFCDLALEMLKDHPDLAVARDRNSETALHVLARKPSTFAGRNAGLLKGLITLLPELKFMSRKELISTQALQLVRCLWEEILKRDDSELTKLIGTPSQLLFDAAKLGNFEFLAELICCYPDVVYELDDNSHSIFHIAILHRHANIFNLIYETAFTKELMGNFEDNNQNNILHLVAKYPDSSRVSIVSGAALQMQRELLWFKEIEKMVQPSFREKKNSEGKTPQEIFTEEHKELLKNGELWMKKTAESCMLVATLISTMMFAAAFSVPGGNDNNRGTPIYLKESLFQVFALSDVIALSSSTISILMFLYILTSRYAEDDFLKSLPFKLMVGLSTLFISIISMMVGFCTTFFLAYHDRLNCLTMLTAVLASVPVTLFVMLQYPLLRDIFCSTYQSRFLFRPLNL